MVEYYTDMLRTYNEAGYRPGSRDISDRRFANLWGARVPDRFPEHFAASGGGASGARL